MILFRPARPRASPPPSLVLLHRVASVPAGFPISLPWLLAALAFAWTVFTISEALSSVDDALDAGGSGAGSARATTKPTAGPRCCLDARASPPRNSDADADAVEASSTREVVVIASRAASMETRARTTARDVLTMAPCEWC